MAIEKLDIQHIGTKLRHGKPFITFTLWLAANLTIADYALGSLFYGLPFNFIVLAILLGNILGGLLLGLMASMGPKFGYPQMMISRAHFGKKGNAPFAIANWISTVGWFTVNIILGSYAMQLALGLPIFAGALLLILIEALLAIYGHDMIHNFEIFMSIMLGIMFLAVGVMAYNGALAHFAAYQAASAFSLPVFALCIAAVFSYLMSWSTYASDYSRYLPENTSRLRITVYAMLAGLIACSFTEIIGALVYINVGNVTMNPINALAQVTGGYSLLAMVAIILGSITANSLNIYTNSLSAQIAYEKTKRWQAVIAGCAIGFGLVLLGSGNFGSFYQNFLLTLDYWITPWIGITLAAFFLRKVRSGVENQKGILWRPIAAYIIGLGISAPLMNLTPYGIPFEGFIASMFGGADVSYFISFFVAAFAYLLLTRKTSGK